MDFSAEVRMGHTALLSNADILVVATPAHEVYCSIEWLTVVLCATSIDGYVAIFGTQTNTCLILQLTVAGEQSRACQHLNKRLDSL